MSALSEAYLALAALYEQIESAHRTAADALRQEGHGEAGRAHLGLACQCHERGFAYRSCGRSAAVASALRLP